MCGIAGVLAPDDRDNARRVARMLGRLQHRGPDEEGLRQFDGGAIGVRRLSIIDVAGGQQPISNEDGTIWAVQNGEIYNFADVRRELQRKGHRFRTDSDTEVIPHAYEEYGDGFPAKLRGMFAIEIWDGRRRRLVLVRDRVGKKPLLYAPTADGIAFASEIQALLTLPLPRDVDAAAIREYLTLGYINAPRSAFRAIRKVRPGHLVAVDESGIREVRYWQVRYSPKLRLSEEEATQRLRALLAEAVRLRLISEVPLGVFLSGGIDSSIVVALMAEQSAMPVRTFSIGFADEDYSELRYARLIAARYATEHHEYVVEAEAASILPLLVRHFGEPFADSSAVPTYYVAKTARPEVTVVLNGDGGDELFAGYERYRAARLAAGFERLGPLRGAVASAARRLPAGAGAAAIVGRARRFGTALGLDAAARYLRWVGYFPGDDPIYGESYRGKAADDDPFREAIDASAATGPVDTLLAADLGWYLPGDLLVKMDIATMANSVEARSPFLDHEVIEFAAALPSDMKLRGRTSKYLLRRLARDLVPEEVLRRRKMGLVAPVGRWIRGPLRPLVSDVLLAMPDRGFVDPAAVRSIVVAHMNGTEERARQVWALLMLELWFRHVAAEPAVA